MKMDRVRFDHGSEGTIQRKNGDVEVGTFSAAEEGKPIPPGAELVQINYRASQEWHEPETLYRNGGPAQVATPKYREGYDRIFGKKREVGLA